MALPCPLPNPSPASGRGAFGGALPYGNGFPSTRTGAWMSQMPSLPTGTG
jgi:hypothetical protein